MTTDLGGLELLVPTTLSLAKTLIQSREKIIGCIRGTHVEGEESAFILLDTRLLYLNPGSWGKKTLSIEYLDIRTVEIEEVSSGLFGHGYLQLNVETDYRGDASKVYIFINPRHKQYTINFAEVLRAKVREARMPSPKVEKHAKSPATFIDELERLNSLHKEGGLTDEEFELAKRKLLS